MKLMIFFLQRYHLGKQGLDGWGLGILRGFLVPFRVLTSAV
jgi:hypothetical protein